MATVHVEGQTLTLEDSICRTDKSLIAALLPFYPAVGNAEIKRKTEGENTTINVVKKAGTKGLRDIVAALESAPETISPILLLEASGGRRASAKTVDEAVLLMFEEEAEIRRMTETLDRVSPETSKTTPTGF